MRIVASLTTLPGRINYIKPTIKSLLNQSRPLDMIYINIPYKSMKGEKYVIPEFFNEFPPEKITINRCTDNGPITKIIPTLYKETDPSTYIISFDDDNIIHKDVVKIFSIKSKQYPNAALSFSGFTVGKFPFIFHTLVMNNKDQKVDWIQGVHGIMYKREFLDPKELLDFLKTQPKYIHRHDDHIICVYLARKNIDRISIKGNANYYFTHASYRKIDAISGENSLGSLKFIMEMANIGFYYKKKGYYTCDNNNIVYSIAFYIYITIVLFILIMLFVPKNRLLVFLLSVIILKFILYFFIYKFLIPTHLNLYYSI